MANNDRFKKLGSIVGEGLDKVTSKISDTVKNFDKEQFKEDVSGLSKNVSDIGKKIVKTTAEKYDEAIGEDKYCIVCGKKLGLIGKRKIADGTLCNSCSTQFKEVAEHYSINLAQANSADLIELKRELDAKRKKQSIYLIIAMVALSLLGMLYLRISASREAAREAKAHENMVDVSTISYSIDTETYDSIGKKFKDAGFTNIEYSIKEDLSKDKSALVGIVDKIEINGDSNLKNMDWVDKDATVTLYYHVLAPEKEETNTASNSGTDSNTTNNSSSTPSTTPSSSSSSSSSSEAAATYTSNDKDHYKDGDSGKYAYVASHQNYDIYLIIDFDEGYVYRFLDGDGSTDCDKVPITSGTLNDVLIITYHDGGSSWQNGLHFKYKNQPDHLILEDDDHFEYDFTGTSLKTALSKKSSKKIYNY